MPKPTPKKKIQTRSVRSSKRSNLLKNPLVLLIALVVILASGLIAAATLSQEAQDLASQAARNDPSYGTKCNLKPAPGKIIVNIAQLSSGRFIQSNLNFSAASIDDLRVNIPAGRYKVEMQSYDVDHTQAGGDPFKQPKEQWYAQLDNVNGTVGTTPVIRDISDTESFVTDAPGDVIQLKEAATKMSIYHAAFVDGKPTPNNPQNANSVNPICIAFITQAEVKPTPKPGDPGTCNSFQMTF